ncbi:hypothetical protein K470DRAFT_42485 [Piedraia hortae CBS 480.64]|uniref:Uncharacterized protein n=1 Tax=Piedraia hortae CBS 480.64 TaxID=1314780 RepID=A0A6A7C1E8_9PEZI|nr:hypothetical protein K470DRAFT_42485 [Piedraia hortae CBS 480.64]
MCDIHSESQQSDMNSYTQLPYNKRATDNISLSKVQPSSSISSSNQTIWLPSIASSSVMASSLNGGSFMSCADKSSDSSGFRHHQSEGHHASDNGHGEHRSSKNICSYLQGLSATVDAVGRSTMPFTLHAFSTANFEIITARQRLILTIVSKSQQK